MVYLRLLRVHQWIKNLFVLAAAFFGGVFSLHMLFYTLVPGILCFCLVSSAIYILNDLLDAEADRLHPEKSKRPIASGAIGKGTAISLMIVLAVAAIAGGFLINHAFAYVLLTYAVVNICYSGFLKRVSVLDIFLVSSGFILRVYAGGVLTGVHISHWLYIMTFLLALFIAIAKRRDDVLLLETTGTEMRKSIKGYSLEFVNTSMGMMSAVIMVSYILYVTSPEIVQRFPGKPLFISGVFVLAGLLRYLQITLVEKKSGSPTKIVLSDFFIQATIVLWVLFFAVIIYNK